MRMKRILVLSLALILAVGSMIVPSYAAETEFSSLVDLLSFSLPNGGDSKSVLMSPGSTVTFDLPYSTTVYYVDFVVRTDFANMQVTSLTDGASLTTEFIAAPSGTLYRVYGKLNGYTLDQLRFRFDASSGGTVVFESFLYSSLPVFGIDTRANCYLYVAGDFAQSSYVPGQQGPSLSLSGNNQDLSMGGSIELTDWRDFDYIDIMVALTGGISITSLSCFFVTEDGDAGGTYIPFDHSFVNTGHFGEGDVCLLVRVYLTGLDRTSSNSIEFSFDGEYRGIYACSMYLERVTGGLIPSDVNPVVLLLQKLSGNLAGWFTNLGLNISTGFQNVINAVNTNTQNIADFLFGEFNRLIEAITGTGDTDGFQDQVDQQGDKLDQMDEALNSVTKPALDRVDTNISGIVSDTDLSNTAHVYTYIIDDNIMAPALTMVAILAMMSFALFGKR